MNENQSLTKGQKAWGITKKLSKRWFIDAFTGMAQGLFVTLIAGTIIKTLGSNVINEIFGVNKVGNFLILLGQVASILMGAGIGAGIAYFLKTNKLVTFACIVAGFMGAYSSQLLGTEFTGESIIAVKFTGGNLTAVTGLLSKGSPGNPIGAYVCALMAAEIGNLVAGKTKLDILLVPLTCIFVAFVGLYCAYPFIWLVEKLGKGIEVATKWNPFIMGIVIAVVMGILLTMPTSSAAIWVAVASGNTSSYMMLAGGAAVVGCACQMVGFAVMSYRENKVSGLISQGLGTSMLQIPNIMKKPIVMLPPIIASAICGPIATCVFKLKCTASGGGMGTSGLVGVFGTIEAMGTSSVLMWFGIALLMFILPAVLCLVMSEFMRKKGWLAQDDLKL